MSKYRRTRSLHIYDMEEIGVAAHVILPGMKQRMEVPRDPLMGQTMVLPARFGPACSIRGVDPLIVYAYAVMAALGFPIRVRQSTTIRIRTTRSLAGPEAVKPWLGRRKRIAAVVAGLYPADKCRNENAEGEAEDRDLHAHVRRLIKAPIQITQVVHVSLIVSIPSFPALTFVKAGLGNTSLRGHHPATQRSGRVLMRSLRRA